MELRRILKPGGYGLFTVHDENTWKYLAKDDEMRTRFFLGFHNPHTRGVGWSQPCSYNPDLTFCNRVARLRGYGD